jgi:hypothetical protein
MELTLLRVAAITGLVFAFLLGVAGIWIDIGLGIPVLVLLARLGVGFSNFSRSDDRFPEARAEWVEGKIANPGNERGLRGVGDQLAYRLGARLHLLFVATYVLAILAAVVVLLVSNDSGRYRTLGWLTLSGASVFSGVFYLRYLVFTRRGW